MNEPINVQSIDIETNSSKKNQPTIEHAGKYDNGGHVFGY